MKMRCCVVSRHLTWDLNVHVSLTVALFFRCNQTPAARLPFGARQSGDTGVFVILQVRLSGSHDTFMTAVWSRCTLGAPGVDGWSLCCLTPTPPGPFPQRSSSRGLFGQETCRWEGERRPGHNGWKRCCVWGRGGWSDQRVRGSRCWIGLLWGQSPLFNRERERSCWRVWFMCFCSCSEDFSAMLWQSIRIH